MARWSAFVAFVYVALVAAATADDTHANFVDGGSGLGGTFEALFWPFHFTAISIARHEQRSGQSRCSATSGLTQCTATRDFPAFFH